VRILDKYAVREFTRTIMVALFAFITIFITLDVVEYVDDFIDNNVAVPTIIKFYAFQIPHIFILSVPIAILISALLTVGQMARHNELTAIKASGIRLSRTAMPLIAVGIVASLVSLAVGEMVMPKTDTEVLRIKTSEIKKTSGGGQPRIQKNISYRGKKGLFYFAPEYDTRLQVMKDVVIEKWDKTLVFRINAKKATWKDSAWVLSEAWVRWFSEVGEVERETFVLEDEFTDIKDFPHDIAKVQKDPEEMSYWELRSLIMRIEQSGADATRYQVGLNMKIAFPFTNVIVILLGAPLSARLRRGGIAVGIGLGLGLCFVYYGFIRVGQALGDHAVLPPLAAAWIGNVFFAAAGIILLLRAEKH
jgi:lipopolysaccharide export system permease protein